MLKKQGQRILKLRRGARRLRPTFQTESMNILRGVSKGLAPPAAPPIEEPCWCPATACAPRGCCSERSRNKSTASSKPCVIGYWMGPARTSSSRASAQAPVDPVPLFPPYVFARCEGRSQCSAASDCPGAFGGARFGEFLVAVKDGFVGFLRKCEGEQGYLAVRESSKPPIRGQRARVLAAWPGGRDHVWRADYSHQRPHSSLGDDTPAALAAK